MTLSLKDANDVLVAIRTNTFETVFPSFPSNMIIYSRFPYMNTDTWIFKHSVLYGAVWLNKYDCVSYLLSNYPDCFKMAEAIDYLCQLCRNHSYDLLALMAPVFNTLSINFVEHLYASSAMNSFFYNNINFSFILHLLQLLDLPTTVASSCQCHFITKLMYTSLSVSDNKMIQLLLEYGLDPNIIISSYSPYLHCVKSAKTANLLLQYGAFVNIEDVHGLLAIETIDPSPNSCWQFAVSWTHGVRHDDIHDVLLLHGSEPPKQKQK